MITLTQAQLEGWISQLYWPFIRIGACFMVAPAFGALFIPARMRLVLAGAVAFLVAPLIPQPTGIVAFSPAGIVITIQQVIIGVIIWLAVWWDQVRRRRLSADTGRDGRREEQRDEPSEAKPANAT